MSLLEVLLAVRVQGESMRSAFLRARDGGMLDGIPGLVYALGSDGDRALVNTGTQCLLGDLDELPHPAIGFRLFEAPSRRHTLAAQPLPASKIHRYSPIAPLVLTLGCRFGGPYCPIPDYNQRQFRCKSGERIADEMARLEDHQSVMLGAITPAGC